MSHFNEKNDHHPRGKQGDKQSEIVTRLQHLVEEIGSLPSHHDETKQFIKRLDVQIGQMETALENFRKSGQSAGPNFDSSSQWYS